MKKTLFALLIFLLCTLCVLLNSCEIIIKPIPSTTKQEITEDPPLDTHEHFYSSTVTEPTCTEQGYTTYICECGDNYVDNYVEAPGHTWGEWQTITEPTYTIEGIKERICDICGTIEKELIAVLKGSEGLEFALNEDNHSYSVVGIGTCTDIDIVIPEAYEGLFVTKIGYQAFYNEGSVTSVVIPDSVTNIAQDAFEHCHSLVNVKIGNSVTTIESWAFGHCSSLANIEIPDSVTSIGQSAFEGCTSLISVEFGENSNLTSIEPSTFENCESLRSVKIPQRVTSIGIYAFNNCKSLTNIRMGNLVTSIGGYAFHNCILLSKIVIPHSMTSIGEGTFSECISLTRIEIPLSVQKIGKFAFYRCNLLTIYCQAESQPTTWDSSWNSDNRPVVWGYEGE